MKKKKIRLKWKNIIRIILSIFFISCIVISSIKLINWKEDSNNTKNEIKNITENTIVETVEDSKSTEIIKPTVEIPKANPYWDYIKMNLINVDFNELKNKNDDTLGWIQVMGTNINYPFVQTSNNDYYLTHSFDKSYNESGWVFLDYRNDLSNLEKNTILYAHGRLDNTMFGSLKNIFTNNWLNNPDNYVIKLSTEHNNTLWQVFSVYKIPTTNDYIRTEFISNQDKLDFGLMLINRSQHNFNTTIEAEDKILTLSTCYDNNNKVVLHAKLIKIENK